MAAVLQFLTGKAAGRQQRISSGPLPIADPRDPAAAYAHLRLEPPGWCVVAIDAKIVVRVNGRPVIKQLIHDRDIIGCGRSLYRIYLPQAGLAAAAPRRTISVESIAQTRSRQPGLSTVVTAPGRWGDVAAAWYNEVVLQLEGRAETKPHEVIARLARRVNCYALIASQADVSCGTLTGELQLAPLNDPEHDDAPLIRSLWSRNAFVGILSPLEYDVLCRLLRPLTPLLAHPSAVRPLLRMAEQALVDGLRGADAAVLFGGVGGWELYCCPEIRPLWKRLGLPGKETTPGWSYRTIECSAGLTQFDRGASDATPAAVAALLATRGSLYLLLDEVVASLVPPEVPMLHVPGGNRGCRVLVCPDARELRFELIHRFWGRGAIHGLISSRAPSEIQRLAAQLPTLDHAFVAEISGGAPRDVLYGFDAILFDPADGGWTIYADSRLRPIWQQYGLPTPVLGGAA